MVRGRVNRTPPKAFLGLSERDVDLLQKGQPILLSTMECERIGLGLTELLIVFGKGRPEVRIQLERQGAVPLHAPSPILGHRGPFPVECAHCGDTRLNVEAICPGCEHTETHYDLSKVLRWERELEEQDLVGD